MINQREWKLFAQLLNQLEPDTNKQAWKLNTKT